MSAVRRPGRSEERAVLQSVLYAALFDYPLTTSQLRDALIGEVADEATLVAWFNNSAYLQHTIEFDSGYFFPRGRRDLLATRARREATSRTILSELARPLRVITRMPFVRMVALSGSLAHLNAEPGADLDLFVITSPSRVWTVTVATLAVAHLCGWRKRLCLNYVVSERALWIAPADLFSANQIVHLQPLVGAEAYSRFLEANRFVARFYPNFSRRPTVEAAQHRWWFEPIADYTLAPLLEPLCRFIYRTHLRRQAHTWRSHDQVRLEAQCLKLHTRSHRREIMERFEAALDAALTATDPPAPAPTREESPPLQASW